MLSKEYRLPSRAELNKSSFFKTSLFAVKYAKNDLPESRFAFLVRKKTEKRAVKRNRIRRVFRSCIEQMLEEISPGYDMLFFLERGIMEKPYSEVFEELKRFFSEKNLLSK